MEYQRKKDMIKIFKYKNNDIHKWTVTELKEIITKYKFKIKELE